MNGGYNEKWLNSILEPIDGTPAGLWAAAERLADTAKTFGCRLDAGPVIAAMDLTAWAAGTDLGVRKDVVQSIHSTIGSMCNAWPTLSGTDTYSHASDSSLAELADVGRGCHATTVQGERCKVRPASGSEFCWHHDQRVKL